MANSKELFGELVTKIRLRESKDEVAAMVYLLLEHQFGLKKSDIMSGKSISKIDQSWLDEIILRINAEEPIQYILGEAWFYQRKFKVNPSVLIPRPETEIIVRELTGERFSPKAGGSILDIGTGSGCIAISLAKELPGRNVVATDVSREAIQTAMENAALNDANVEFMCHNIITEDFPLIGIEFIVSNPPYIMRSEMEQMKGNVTAHEPPLALYVPDEDPLIFYKAIAQKGKRILTEGGKIMVEINEQFGDDVSAVFDMEGYEDILLWQDLSDKDRFVSATAG